MTPFKSHNNPVRYYYGLSFTGEGTESQNVSGLPRVTWLDEEQKAGFEFKSFFSNAHDFFPIYVAALCVCVCV